MPRPRYVGWRAPWDEGSRSDMARHDLHDAASAALQCAPASMRQNNVGAAVRRLAHGPSDRREYRAP
jgi:hypothetical protein